jgi:hypothetical protein
MKNSFELKKERKRCARRGREDLKWFAERAQ